MNVHDSERLHGVMQRAGFALAEDGDADVVILNTCSVREKAEQKLRSEVGRLAMRKSERPAMAIVVAGCVAQQEGERLLRQDRGIDLVIGPDNIAELPMLLEELAGGAPPMARTVFDVENPHFLHADMGASLGVGTRPTGFVTVMKGCNERCSFCIVPYTRGPERYRASADILAEIRGLVANGIREVTLLGQTVNSYMDPNSQLPAAPDADESDPDESQFAALLWQIAREAPGLLRLRYTSPHPRHLTASLIRAHRELAVLARHVHMPVQSGSDRVLRRMIRRYRREEYLERLARLRGAVPGLTVSTDMIVGFPGESDEDFAETLSLVDEAHFVGVFAFKYSPRPKTPALRLGDDVPELVKAERLAALFARSEALIVGHLNEQVGSTQRVLVEGMDRAGEGHWTGRTQRNEIVHIRDAALWELEGEEVDVRIVQANKHSLVAELVPENRQSHWRSRLPPLSTSRVQGGPAPTRTPDPTRKHSLPVLS